MILLPLIVIFEMACSSNGTDAKPQAMRIMKYDEVALPNEEVRAGNNASLPRMVIKKGSLLLRVNNYQTSFELVKTIVLQEQGFIVSTQVDQYEDKATGGNLIIKVPSARFDTTMSKLKSIADRIENESISGNDVTEEFYDLQARLVNKRKVEQRFQEILKTAKTTKEILEVEQALGEIREEIERMEGRSRFLSDQVNLSTIDLKIYETDYGYYYGDRTFFAKIVQGFKKGLTVFGDVLSVLIVLVIATIPIWILLALLIFISLKVFKRYKSKRK